MSTSLQSLPPVSPIPQPPTTTDLENFNIRADAFLSSLPLFQRQLNSVIDALNPLVPDLPGLDEVVKNIEAVRLTGTNIAQVNATGTNIVSVNAVAVPVRSGALQKLADATAAMRALEPVAVELGELALHLADLSQLSDKTEALLLAVSEIQSIIAAVNNIQELVAVGANMAAVLGVYANMGDITASIQSAAAAKTAKTAAEEARRKAEEAADKAEGFAGAAAGIAGLPIGTENNAPLVWGALGKRWVQGKRPELATADVPGLAAGDKNTITTERGRLRLSRPVSVEAVPDSHVLRGLAGEIHGNVVGNVTGTATPLHHVSTHAKNGPDALTLEAMGYSASIAAEPESLVKRNSRGKIEGLLETPQTPATHAASHQQDGDDPLSLEALGVTISIAPPSGTVARLWIQFF